VLAKPGVSGRVSRGDVVDAAATRDLRHEIADESSAATRRRAPSAPESYTAEEYKSWVSQRHQRSPSAPSRRRSVGPAAAAERRRLTPSSRQLADAEPRGLQPVAGPRAPAARPAARRPVVPASSEIAAGRGGRDGGSTTTLTKKPLKIRTEDFRPYRTSAQTLLQQQQLQQQRSRRRRTDVSAAVERPAGLDGMLSVHVYCGHGLRANPTSLRDLYCVVGVDGLNRARTAVQTGAINFDWDEQFDVDLLDAETVSFGIYSWASSGASSASKQKLFFSGSVHLSEFIQRGGPHQQLALRLDPTGVLYVALEYLDVSHVYGRTPAARPTGRCARCCCSFANRVFTRSSKSRANIELAQAGLLEPRPLAHM